MSRQTKDEILLKVQAAQNLSSEDPEQAELFFRSALKDAETLGQSSATLHLQLAELLYRLRRTRQALEQVLEVLELDPFNLVAVNLHRTLGRRLREGADAPARSIGGVRGNGG
jgi:tetratricopeptide (TPR) repeat protein